MESQFTTTEKKNLIKICDLVLKMNPACTHAEEVHALQKALNHGESLDSHMRRIAKWSMTIPELYCQKKRDVLIKTFGEVVHSLDPAEIQWYSELEKKELLHKLRETNKIPSRKLYISDLHFYHNALNKQMDCRGFKNHEAMNAYMIQQWNAKVTKKDEVYILGDLSIAKGIATNEIVKQLNGKLYYIIGNHDAFLNDPAFDRTRFQWIKPYAEIHDDARTVVLSHYPTFCYNGQYHRKDGVPSVYMLYGHVHNTQDEKLLNHFILETRQSKVKSKYDDEPKAVPCQMINCFCMFSDYQPLTLDEWIANDQKRRKALEEETV